MSMIFAAPANPADRTQNHLGTILGSEEMNGYLWCVSIVLFLIAALMAVFFITMISQIDGKLYSLFENFMGGHFLLQIPTILCVLGILADLLAFASTVTLAWGEDRALCCVVMCAIPIVGTQYYVSTVLVYAVEASTDAQKQLEERTPVSYSIAQLTDKLEAYTAEQATLSRMTKEGYLHFLLPSESVEEYLQGMDSAECQRLHGLIQERVALLPRPRLDCNTLLMAEKLYDKLVQELIQAMVDAADISGAQAMLQRSGGGANEALPALLQSLDPVGKSYLPGTP